MRVRQLPTFRHDNIGKTTHTKKFSYFHVNYIVRESACTKVLAENMPANRDDARSFFEHQAYKDGVAANARVADTFIIALPIELNAERRYDLVMRFMHKIGKHRIAWLAGFHDKGEDAHNPHCHVIFRDADIGTGRKVIGTTTSAKDVKEAKEKGWQVPPRMTTKDLRVTWCKHVNDDMKRLGIDVRFDERRLREQGIDREPQVHVGRKGHAMAKAGKETVMSEDRQIGDRVAAYTLLDAGSRHEHNERIKARSLGSNDNAEGAVSAASLEEARQKQELRERQKIARKDMYAEQKLDRAALRKVHDGERWEHKRVGRALYATARAKAYTETGEAFKDRWKEIQKMSPRRVQRDALKEFRVDQKTAYNAAAAAEIEKVRPEKNARWLAQQAAQAIERQTLSRQHGQEQSALSRQSIAERHALHERWQQTHLKRQADRISGRFETQQSMAVVQSNAIKLIKLRNRQDGGAYTGSDEAIQFFTDTARTEAEKRTQLRQSLTAERDVNLARADATAARSRAQPGFNVPKQHNRDRGIAPAVPKRAANDRGNENRKGQAPPGNAQSAQAKPNGKTEPKKDKPRSDERQGDLFARYRKDYKDKGRDGGRSGR